MNNENIDDKKMSFFKRTGFVFNHNLKMTVDYDRVIAYDNKGRTITYPSLNAAVNIIAKKGIDKANLKSRIRTTIIQQTGLKIMGMYWDVNEEDYLKRV